VCILAGRLAFLSGRGRLRRRGKEHHASAKFFGELAGTLIEFQLNAVRGAVARRISQSAVHLERGGRWHFRNGQQADTEYRQAACGDLDFADLDEALTALAKVDPRKSQVVELRFFGGLNLEETAEVLKVSSDTVMRDWKMAKNCLRCELSGESLDGA